MIEEAVQGLKNQLRSTAANLLPQQPELRLDGSWISVSTLDLINRYLERSTELSREPFINQAAAYICDLAANCWRTFDSNLEISASLVDGDVVISANGGSYLPGEKRFTINISTLLRQVVREPETFGAVFERGEIKSQNCIAAAALGVITGVCPAGQGAWGSMPLYRFAPYLLKAQAFLAKGCADYYRAVFPEEPLGCEPSIYTASLILPPLGFDEEFLAQRSVTELIGFCQETGANPPTMLKFARNLLRLPDELLVGTAYSISAALSDIPATRQLIACQEAWRVRLPKYRQAYLRASELFGMERDWLQCLRNSENKRAAHLITREQQFGFLPLLIVPGQSFLDKKYCSFLEAVAENNHHLAYDMASSLEEDHGSLEFSLNRAFLAFLTGRHEEAIGSIISLCERYTLTGETFGKALTVRALAEFALGKVDTAVTFSEEALKLLNGSLDLKRQNISIMIAGGKFAEVIQLVPATTSSPTITLLRGRSSVELGQHGEGERLMLSAIAASPTLLI